ncbi:MAG: serine/threonine-protein kinase [Myxococcales bacterium]|jgi:hypothetical protein
MAEPSICPTCGLLVSDGAEVCPNDGTALRAVDRTLYPRDPLIGTEVGGYRIERLIGAGGLGLVYGGVQPDIGKPVAIKVLRWEFANDPQQVRRLTAEAKSVNAIRHRGIVDIYSMGELPDGRHYLVMELLEGEPFDRFIERNAPLPALDVAAFVDELLDALGAAHRAGVVHRDLKPSNIFLVQPPHGARYLKLLDFGFAKQTSMAGGDIAQTRSSVVVGTPLYMAPEQARGEMVSPRTDLYALGVIMFEMLTGKPPFSAASVYETIHLHLSAPIPRPSQSRGLGVAAFDELIERLLSKDPKSRPASAEHVREEVGFIAAALREGRTVSRPSTYIGCEDTLRSGNTRGVRRAIKDLGRRAQGTARSAGRHRKTLLILAIAAMVGGAAAVAAYRWIATPTPVADSGYPAQQPGGSLPVPGVATEQARASEPTPEPAKPTEEPGARPVEASAPAPAEPVAVAPAAEPRWVEPARSEAPRARANRTSAPAAKPPKRPATGTLKLHVYPWADLYLDGTLRESGAMDFELELPAGRHTVRLANPKLAEHTETITIIGGQTLEKRVRLKSSDGT